MTFDFGLPWPIVIPAIIAVLAVAVSILAAVTERYR